MAGYQTWKITTSVQLNDEDGTDQGTTVDYETFPHTLPLTVDDWSNYGTVADTAHDANGELVLVVADRLQNEYDRSAEEWFEVWYAFHIQREEVIEDDEDEDA
jgi:hypothetical protein